MLLFCEPDNISNCNYISIYAPASQDFQNFLSKYFS